MDGEPSWQEEIISSIQSGDSEAESQLIDKYRSGLIFVLNSQLGDFALSEDLAQETLIIVISSAKKGKIKNPKALSTYVRQTAINLLVNEKRKSARQKTDAMPFMGENEPERSFELDDPNLAGVYKNQIQKIVNQVINELPQKRDQQIIRETFILGNPKNVVCENNDLSPEHFDRVLYRARQRLKQKLEVKLKIKAKEIVAFVSVCVMVCCASYFGIFQNELRETHYVHHSMTKEQQKNVTGVNRQKEAES